MDRENLTVHALTLAGVQNLSDLLKDIAVELTDALSTKFGCQLDVNIIAACTIEPGKSQIVEARCIDESEWRAMVNRMTAAHCDPENERSIN